MFCRSQWARISTTLVEIYLRLLLLLLPPLLCLTCGLLEFGLQAGNLGLQELDLHVALAHKGKHTELGVLRSQQLCRQLLRAANACVHKKQGGSHP